MCARRTPASLWPRRFAKRLWSRRCKRRPRRRSPPGRRRRWPTRRATSFLAVWTERPTSSSKPQGVAEPASAAREAQRGSARAEARRGHEPPVATRPASTVPRQFEDDSQPPGLAKATGERRREALAQASPPFGVARRSDGLVEAAGVVAQPKQPIFFVPTGVSWLV